MELLSWLLLAVLFIAGLIKVLLPPATTGKFYAWSKRFFPNQTTVSSSETETAGVSASPRTKIRDANKEGELRRIFSSFDKNGDGFITRQEIKESLNRIGIFMTENDIKEVMEKLDANRDGLVDIREFCELFESSIGGEGVRGGNGAEEGGREAELKEAFDVFDEDGDGLISVGELGKVLASFGFTEGKRMEKCREMINKVDVDGDGMVNFDEFKKMMRDGFI